MATFTCDLVTQSGIKYSGDVYMVVVPGTEGDMGFLPGHAPLVSGLRDGMVRIQKENGGSIDSYAIQAGFVEVMQEKVIVVARRAELTSDLDLQALKDQLAELEQKEVDKEDELAASLAEDEITWVKTQIAAVERSAS